MAGQWTPMDPLTGVLHQSGNPEGNSAEDLPLASTSTEDLSVTDQRQSGAIQKNLVGDVSFSKASKEDFKAKLVTHFHALSEQGLNANEAAALALKLACGAVKQPPGGRSLINAVKTARESKDYSQIITFINSSFAALEGVTAAFSLQLEHENHVKFPGIDFTSITEFYDGIVMLESDEVVMALMNATDRILLELLSEATKPSWEAVAETAVRPLLIFLENPYFMDSEHHRVLKFLCNVLVELPTSGRDAFVAGLDMYPKERFEQIVALIQQFLTISLYNSSQLGEAVIVATKVLAILYKSNEQCQRVSHSMFYNDAVNNEDFNIREDYLHWDQAHRFDFSFCKYPFVYNTESKSRILHLDSSSQMSHQFEDALLRSFFLGGGLPFNVIRIRRDHLIADAISQVQRRPEDLKKPLKVQFVGEDGVDEGGVQKEFFQLTLREIFDPKYGMFSYNEETRLYWFNSSLLEMHLEYELIGMVVGLAIYNGHILELRFPTVIYKKLLGTTCNFHDLAEVDPSMAKGLIDLLNFQGDVQEVYMRNFQISVCDMFGQISTVDLNEGGGNVPVTGENRNEYVELCVDYYLNKSIEQPFNAFSKGFHQVCGGPILQMFHPEELELLICGSTVLDFEALEKFTRYEDGYTKESQIIKDFWQVVHSLSEDQKKRLLFFATGSDRVPIKGLADLPFVISRNGPDSERLPTSHTCFNHLLLPEYNSLEKMKNRLILAIDNAEGFGLI